MKRNMRVLTVLAVVVLQWLVASPTYGETNPSDVLQRLASTFKINDSGSIPSSDDIRKKLAGLVALSEADGKLKTWVGKFQAAEQEVKQEESNLALIPKIKEGVAQIEAKKVKDIDKAMAGLQVKPLLNPGTIKQGDIKEGCPKENLAGFDLAAKMPNLPTMLSKISSIREDIDEERVKSELASIATQAKEQKEKIAEARVAKGEFAAMQKRLQDIQKKGGDNVTDIKKATDDLISLTEASNLKRDALQDKLPDAIAGLLQDVVKSRGKKKEVVKVAAEAADFFAGLSNSIASISKQHISDTKKACKKAERQIQPLVDEVYSLAREQDVSLIDVDAAAAEIDVNCSISEADADNFANASQTAFNAMRSQSDIPALVENIKTAIDGMQNSVNNLGIQMNAASEKCSTAVVERDSVKKKRDELRGSANSGEGKNRSFSRRQGRPGRGLRGGRSSGTHGSR